MKRIELRDQPAIVLPDALLDNLRMVHGATVDAWLDGLPNMIQELLTEQDASIVPGDPSLSYHLVFFARRSSGEEIAIKCTVPNDEQPPEMAAVALLSDAGIGPRLHWSDLERGVLMMDRVRPGHGVSTGMPSLAEDAEITRQIATLARDMSREVSVGAQHDQLTTVREYTRALGEVDRSSALWDLHGEDIERALDLRDAMLAAPDRRDVFLHGDLHHYNILRDEHHSWRVIDPKGLIGPAGYEFGALTYNPVGIQHHPDIAAIERQRVEIWSEVTGPSWETVRSWGYVAAVLSACWSGQGGVVQWHDAMSIATILRDLEPFS